MRTFFVMGYVFLMALMICSGTFMWYGLVPTTKVIGSIAFTAAFIMFERICKIAGVYK